MNQQFGPRSLKAPAIAAQGLAPAGYAPVARRIPPGFVRALARVTDFTAAVLTGLAVAGVCAPDRAVLAVPTMLIGVALTGLAAVAMFELLGLYAAPRLKSVRACLRDIAAGWTASFGLLAAASVLALPASLLGLPLALWYVSGAMGVLAGRLALARLVWRWERAGRLARRTAIYGTGPLAEELVAALEQYPASDLCICGVYDDGSGKRALRTLAGSRGSGGIEDLIAFARASRLDLAIVAVPLVEEERLAAVVRRLSVLPVEIKLPAGAMQVRFGRRLTGRAGETGLIDVVDQPIPDWGLLAKAVFDRTVGLAAVALLAPVLLAVAAAVKLDSRGPVLFRQKRYGFNNQLIDVFKFRSIYVDQGDSSAASLVTRGDPRVTRVGRFIRRTSLDELPQLFNVLRGDLSLVGPRPHALEAKAENRLYGAVVEDYFARHKVKPGITGWAQINGWRGETDTIEKIRKRVEHDLYYIENWSLAFDLLILARTPLALLDSKQAY
jgi:Undecaprenyl-phosphate glucose phosphotransferase